jgi:ubiquitin-protein ligase
MATNIAHARLAREFKEVITSSEASSSGVRLEMVKDDLSVLRGEVRGPPDTPYDGGVFELCIDIPDTYPFNPPKVKFVTRLWHPNISSQTGTICLDILKDQWCVCVRAHTPYTTQGRVDDITHGASVHTGAAQLTRTERSTRCRRRQTVSIESVDVQGTRAW